MYTENDYPNIHIWLDEDDSKVTEADVLAGLANGGSVDFVNITNEGYPVYLGNSYARYEFVALNDGLVFTYPMGPIEVDELNEKRELVVEPFGWNDIDEVMEAYEN